MSKASKVCDKLQSRPTRAQLQAFIESVPIEELHKVRPEMLRLGRKLAKKKDYPAPPVVDRLAEMFVSRLIAERN